MITFDGPSKRIILDQAAYSAAQIWSNWVRWHALNPKWLLAFNLVGGIDLGDGASIPPYFFLVNGWRVRPMEQTHVLKISGNLVVQGGGDPVVPTIGNFNVSVQYTVPVLAQGISTTGGGSSITPAQIWQHVIESGMSAENLLRLIVSHAAGAATGLESGTPQFKSLDGAKVRINGTYTNGDRTITSLDATP